MRAFRSRLHKVGQKRNGVRMQPKLRLICSLTEGFSRLRCGRLPRPKPVAAAVLPRCPPTGWSTTVEGTSPYHAPCGGGRQGDAPAARFRGPCQRPAVAAGYCFSPLPATRGISDPASSHGASPRATKAARVTKAARTISGGNAGEIGGQQGVADRTRHVRKRVASLGGTESCEGLGLRGPSGGCRPLFAMPPRRALPESP